MKLRSDGLQLIPLDDRHAETFSHDLTSGENFQYTFTGSVPKTTRELIEEWDQERKAGAHLWAIDRYSFVGIVGLYAPRHFTRSWEFRIMISAPGLLGKGIGTLATRAVVDWGFKRLNAHRIWLGCSAENLGAIKCYEKVGFKREGVLRDEIWCNGHYTDAIRMGLLESDWKEEVHVEA